MKGMGVNPFTTKIFIISGPSGSGKTTVIQELLRNEQVRNRICKTISYTTRRPRQGERDGEDYCFVSAGYFKKMIRRGFFLEWKRVLQNYYGTPRSYVAKARKERKHLLLCIDVKGALQVKDDRPKETVLIFIMPPSKTELRRRLKKRTTETPQEIRKRLSLAEKEIKMAKKYDYCIINDTLKSTVSLLEHIYIAEQYRRWTI